MRVLHLLVLITVIYCFASYNNTSCHEEINDMTKKTLEDSISDALDYQLKHYPESQYIDVYKNFMQDFFGPGHILADTASSARYLRHELSSTDSFGGPLYEKTGYRGNFYRVNLSLIKDNTIPFDTFFKISWKVCRILRLPRVIIG